MIKVTGTIQRTAEHPGWDGRLQKRLDMTDEFGKWIHVYADSDHDLSTLQVGDVLELALLGT